VTKHLTTKAYSDTGGKSHQYYKRQRGPECRSGSGVKRKISPLPEINMGIVQED
jgi:hypothetical protein